MPGIAGIFEASKVDVTDSLVRLEDYSDADVPVLLVFPVQGIADHIVAGFWVEGTDTQNFVGSRSTTHFTKSEMKKVSLYNQQQQATLQA